MKERPILFSGEMVRAILEGRKTQTRRIIKGKRDANGISIEIPRFGKIGDLLYVRETWSEDFDGRIQYRADTDGTGRKWKPSIHMPRRVSRITLEITNIRVERLNDISEEDSEAEGVSGTWTRDLNYKWHFKKLWESLNGAGSWEKNPWVWVVEFKVVQP